MRVTSRNFWLPKAGNAEDEYEDAVWPAHPVDRETRVFRCAVADGATETSFSGLWAQLLVRSYCRGELSRRRVVRELPRLQARWSAAVGTRPLPWYAEEKARCGAFTSLLGLTLRVRTDGRTAWDAVAIGDSCLFHVRGGHLIRAFPITDPEGFSNRPALLSSNRSQTHEFLELAQTAGGCAEVGDSFFLMTDALACWALVADAADDTFWTELGAASWESTCFGGLVGQLRAGKALRNDDVTLLRLDVLPAAQP